MGASKISGERTNMCVNIYIRMSMRVDTWDGMRSHWTANVVERRKSDTIK